MKKLLIISLLALSTQAFSNIISVADIDNNCTSYKVLKGDERTVPLEPGEKLVLKKQVYGMALKNMKIDFSKRQVTFDLFANVVFGLNNNVKSSVIVTEDHPNFYDLTNQVNQKLNLLYNVCLNSRNEIVYASFTTEEN